MAWNEDRLHRWLAARAVPKLLAGRTGNDAAVLPEKRERQVQCADQCVQGVHFEAGAGPRAVGRKAANRALSDLAATAARPRSILLTIAASQAVSERWLRAAIEGAGEAAEACGAALVGGDLSSCAEGLVLSVFASGTLAGRRKPPGRDRARPGQCVLLTGPVGGSLLGRHLRFEPRVAAGLELFERGAGAMMDVSDGLAWDLHRLARASGVRIELQHVPLHRDAFRQSRLSGRTALDHGLHDGEDHELLACMAERARPSWTHAIGKVRPGAGLWLSAKLNGDGRGRLWKPEQGGWKHEPQS